MLPRVMAAPMPAYDVQARVSFRSRIGRQVKWSVDLDDVLQPIEKDERRSTRILVTFSKSIIASAPIRVSRMSFTIHFSPSSQEMLSRSERWLGARSVRQGHRKNVRNTPDVYTSLIKHRTLSRKSSVNTSSPTICTARVNSLSAASKSNST